MLTQEQVEILAAHFNVDDYDWLDGNAYIREDKIVERLNAVDPSWEWVIDRVWREGNQVNAQGRLIVCGITRSGTGTQTVMLKHVYRKDSSGKNVKTDEIVMEGSYPVEVGEAEKGATTDAFKRTARLFMIGGHILQFRRLGIVDEKSLRAWLTKQTKPVQATAPARRIPEEPAQQQAQDVSALTPAEAGEPATIEWFRTLLDTYNISSKEALKLLDVAKLSQWTSTLGIAENLIRTKIEVDRAHNENQQQRQPNNAEIKTSEPVDKITIKRDKHGKGYAVAAGITFYSRELWTEAGITFDEFSAIDPATYELSVRVKIQYVVENGFKKPVKIELA